MRAIKFRGKANDGRWIYGGLVYSDNIEPAIYFEVGNKVCRMEWAYVDHATVGQFTGLTDKNDKEIYEGDIVAEGAFKRVISFIPEAAAFCSCSPYESSIRTRTSADEMRYYEVVGNVFDNPELIEKGGQDEQANGSNS